MTALVVALTARQQVGNFLSALVTVYTILIIAWVLSQLFFNFGGRLPYARWTSAVLEFLNQVVGPYLAFFRRFIPMLGGLDLSPIVGILVLQFVGQAVASLVYG